jgi:hypothetical protein
MVRQFAVLFAAGVLLGACSSASKVSLGDDGTGLRAVDPDSVHVATRTCGASFAHATVCCAGARCTTRDNAPFHPCATGETAYPDGLRCCSLSDPSQCTACDPNTAACGTTASPGSTLTPTPVAPSIGGCEHCPPGYTGGTPSTTGCCRSTENESMCMGVSGCAGAGCPQRAACAPSCAAGFVLTPPQIDVCCRAGGDRTDCYVWVAGDVNGLSCGGNGTACACQRDLDGHAYQMDCDDGTLRCSCSVDGTITKAVTLAAAGACQSTDAREGAWSSACSFPP